MDLSQLRYHYTQSGLSKQNIDVNPVEQLNQWMNEAIKSGIREPNAASLATVAKDGQPNQRIILIKKIEESGLVFFTNYEGQKAKEMAANPKVALNFVWLDLERQVRVHGEIEKISREESLAYFMTRLRGSQIGAWASPQSQVVKSRKALQERINEFEDKFNDKDIPMPDYWGGYRIKPHQFEFWQGREFRLHDRIQYSKGEGSEWTIQRLAP